MNILKYAVLFVAIIAFCLSALVVRNDPKNQNPMATVILCLSMAAMICWSW